jgi:hypothetical protein
MQQAKFSVEQTQIDFLNNYRVYGFKDKSSMVRAALNRLKEELELQSLKRSADVYAEMYAEDPELKELTEAAMSEWPE